MNDPESQARYQELAEKWLNGTITGEEAKEYFGWYNQLSSAPVEIPPAFARDEADLRNRLLENIHALRTERRAALLRTLQGSITSQDMSFQQDAPAPEDAITSQDMSVRQNVSTLQDAPPPLTGQPQALPGLLSAGGAATSLPGRTRVLGCRWLPYAAAVLLAALGLGSYYLYQAGTSKSEAVATTTEKPAPTPDIAPGSNRAVLTLSDGSSVVLDDAAMGHLAVQGGAEIIKMADGEIGYRLQKGAGTEVVYNTMTTPRGGQYQVLLPDGSKAWLNAESSLRYPTVFKGKERRVKISGEVYLEVARKETMPFVVDIDEQTAVQVLGTSFNINAYNDEPDRRITLLSGSVAVLQGDKVRTIAPGQQVRAGAGIPIEVISQVDLDEVMAWKNGTFSFSDADIQKVMRQLARWYNVDVQYDGKPPGGSFSGEIGRSLTLQQVLNGLSQTRIDFRIADNTIFIQP